MSKTNLEEFKEKTPEASFLFSKPLSKEYGLSTNITFMLQNPKLYDSSESRSYIFMFIDEDYLPNSIKMESPINHTDATRIAEEMYQQYKSNIDFEEFEMVKNGECFRKDFDADDKDTTNYCEECPYRLKGDCWGPAYTVPSGIDNYKIEKKWNPIYGVGGTKTIEYARSCLLKEIKVFEEKIGDDSKVVREETKQITKRIKRIGNQTKTYRYSKSNHCEKAKKQKSNVESANSDLRLCTTYSELKSFYEEYKKKSCSLVLKKKTNKLGYDYVTSIYPYKGFSFYDNISINEFYEKVTKSRKIVCRFNHDEESDREFDISEVWKYLEFISFK